MKARIGFPHPRTSLHVTKSVSCIYGAVERNRPTTNGILATLPFRISCGGPSSRKTPSAWGIHGVLRACTEVSNIGMARTCGLSLYLEREESRCLVHGRRDHLCGNLSKARERVTRRRTACLRDDEVERGLQLREVPRRKSRSGFHPTRTEEPFGVPAVCDHLEQYCLAPSALSPSSHS